MSKLSNYIYSNVKEIINFLETVNDKINNKDTSSLQFLENDLEGILSSASGEGARKFVDSLGFFEKMSVISEAKTLKARMDNLNSRLSNPSLYIDTCKLGMEIIKEDFSDQEKIIKFYKNYDECKYYKDKFLDLLAK